MYPSIAFVWKGDTIIGYCNTMAEADYICTKEPSLTWSYSIENQNPENFNLLNIHYF